jgi:hypothetical protein
MIHCSLKTVLLLLIAAPAWAETRVDFHLNKALLGGTAKDWQRTVHISLTLKDGVAELGKIGPARGGSIGGWSTVGWTGRVEGVDVRRTGDKVTGTIRAYVTSNELDTGEYTFAIDGEMKDGKLAGKFASKCGKLEATGPIMGDGERPAAKVDVEDSILILVLDKALPKGEVMKIYLDRKDGKFRSAFAFATSHSRRPFEIDAADLAIKDGELAGTIKVLRTIGKTKDQPLLGSYQVKAKIQGASLRGSHAGQLDADKGAGDVWGEIANRPTIPDSVHVSTKLEDGLFGPSFWQNRAFFDFLMNMGKANSGKMFNNKGVYKGRFDRAELTLSGDRMKGRVEGTVLEGAVVAGSYVFELDGQMVGPYFAGQFTTRLGDKTKTGYFVGGVSIVP